jgi:hypothetical protein
MESTVLKIVFSSKEKNRLSVIEFEDSRYLLRSLYRRRIPEARMFKQKQELKIGQIQVKFICQLKCTNHHSIGKFFKIPLFEKDVVIKYIEEKLKCSVEKFESNMIGNKYEEI